MWVSIPMFCACKATNPTRKSASRMGKLYLNCYAVLMSNSVSPIPPGFHTLSVHLIVNDATAYVDFLKRAFNAEEVRRSPGPGGKLMHVQMKIGDSMIMFA